jgi:hypothetical protein
MKTNKVLLAAVAGLLSVGTLAATTATTAQAAEKVKCYGANECKGHGSCAGAQGCAGKNACKGQGFVFTDSKEACLKMDGGRLTEKPEQK